ncbi:unnamed protein product, partial [Strongylus vulgaris]
MKRREKYTHYLFYDGETISGTVNVALKKANQKLEHQGIRIEFIGQIVTSIPEVYYDRGNQQDFISLTKDLARPGELTQNSSFHFEFHNVEKPYESYMGINVKLRLALSFFSFFSPLLFLVIFTFTNILAKLSATLQILPQKMDLIVHTLSSYPDADVNLKMDVSKIYFVLVRIKIKHMEITIIKSETVGSGPNAAKETDPVAKFEIMDGAPVRGESIPIRLFLAGHDLAPTMRDVSKKFSVRYLLNLVLVDEEDRRYFKQQA